MTEPRPHAIAGEIEPCPFVIGRAPASARPREQCVEQLARERDVPFFARTKYLFKLRTQPSRILRRHVRRAAAERAVDQFERLVDTRMPRRRGAVLLCRRVAAQLEFEAPAARGIVGRDAVHFKRADFGQRRGQLHRRLARAAVGLPVDDGRDRRQPHEVAAVEIDEIARPVRGIGNCRHQVKAHRLPELQRERTILQPDLAALFRTARQQAHAARPPVGRAVVEHEEIAARRAAADARRMPGAGETVCDRTACDRDVRMRVVQHVERRAAPRTERLREAARQRVRTKHAAVEQQRVGQRTFRVTVQERGDVPRDGRIARVRQAEFDDRRTRTLRQLVGRDLRKKAVDDDLLDLAARQLGRTCAADEPAAGTEQRDGHRFGRIVAEQALLRRAATLDELRQARGRQPRAGLGQARLDEAREREVHVVAAEHQMIADADARKRRLAIVAGRDVDERQIGRAAADVADQHASRRGERVAQRRTLAVQPVVERGLRLLEQPQRGQPRASRGLDGQRARAVVERSGDGQDDMLLRERRVGKVRIPCGTHVREIARARIDGRHLVDAVGSAPRQNRREAIDRRVRQPALRARDEAARHLRAERARVPSDHGRRRIVAARLRGRAGGLPRQPQRVRRQFAGRRVIAHRRQQRLRGDRAGADELLDVEHANRVRAGLDVGDDRIAGAEVDADRIALHYAQAVPRTSNSTFQRSSVPLGIASSSSVPASVTRACSLTGTISPTVRPSAGSVA
ncbi:hypothetical protein FEP67_05030 [Burkholderia multivorans]|nr:hypothetical protein [Burkholderia multivorans]MDR9047983.1 hypothetical protein [Burkholderia multivorans]